MIKLLSARQKELGDPNRFDEISKKYIATFHEDMKALNCLTPSYEPTVTQTMPEIIAFVQGLLM